jgi:hypothetical protein
MGGASAVAFGRAALAAGEPLRAAAAGRLAAIAATGRSSLVADAQVLLGSALEKLAQPVGARVAYEAAALAEPGRGAVREALKRLGDEKALREALPDVVASSIAEACSKVEAMVSAGTLPLEEGLLGGAKVTGCTEDFVLSTGAAALPRAIALRVDLAATTARGRAMWVALDVGSGLRLAGPVAAVSGPLEGEAVNDVIVELQQIDVLPGGAPEVVVKISERRTLPDVALAEVTELDETRAVLLTVDRGGVQASRSMTLSHRARRVALGGKVERLPKGFGAARPASSEFEMKVAWGAPNAMVLSKVSGGGKPPVEGEIVLFP